MLPRCTTEAMTLHLAEISQAVAPGAHAVLLLDQGRVGLADPIVLTGHTEGASSQLDVPAPINKA